MSPFFRLICLLIAFSASTCNQSLHFDRSQFIKEGEIAPTVDLSYYQSVQSRPNQDPALAFAVAISGWGLRASNFAVGVMMGLEKISTGGYQDALDQIDYLSTVSGGSFAGGAYIAALYQHNFFDRKEPFSFATYVERDIKHDLSIPYTGTLLKTQLNPKIWFSSFLDAGDFLEKGIDDNILGFKRMKGHNNAHSIKLGDLFINVNEPNTPVLYPMFFSNSSIVGTKQIFPFSPDILERYAIEGYTHRKKYLVEKKDPFEMPLSVGIKASSSFPVLIPNSTLESKYNPSRPFLHIMDGTLSDNLGYHTAFEVLKQDLSPQKVLLIIDPDTSENLYTFSSKKRHLGALKSYNSLITSKLNIKSLKENIINEGQLFGITPIFVGFHTLIRGLPLPALPEKINLYEERKRLIFLLENRSREAVLTVSDLHVLYEILVNIDPRLSIHPEEQQLLLLAGELIAELVEDQIMEAFGEPLRQKRVDINGKILENSY